MYHFVTFLLLIAAASAWPWMGNTYGDELVKSGQVNSDEPTGARQDKLSSSLAQGINSEYSTLPSFSGKDITSVSNLLKFTTENMATSFDRVSDVLPNGRKKYIHPLGSVAGAQFVSTADHPYTGMFKGADSCLVRLSLAADPDKVSFTPGMAMKCFTDGPSASANFIAMFSLDGQDKDYNFFENEFSNIIPPPTSKVMLGIEDVTFKRASRCPSWLSLKQFGATDQFGNIESDVVHPVELWLVPADIQFTSDSNKDFRNDLATIPVKSTLWTVEVSDSKGGDRTEIGKIVSESLFVASSWGDTVLFFQHDRGEDDNCSKQ